ncbi:hypothetical protein SLA2020_139380 [Shorea laevis]
MAQQTQPCSSWGTWEELLLACAVKRHGLHNWDSVSMELRTKTSLPRPLTTAQICQQKYRDLQRRFTANHPQDQTPTEIPWLEDLRKLRVAELKRDLHRYDVSILALQLKVKKLEEERERTLSTSQDAEDKPDLGRGSENDKTPPAEIPQPGKVPGNSVSGEEENRSVNGSNSTGSERREKEKTDPDPVRAGQGEMVADSTGSEELGELSSDVQSSASLGRKRKRRRRRVELCGGDGIKDKSEASAGLLEKIRAHGESGLFERRLQSQESKDYKDLVRQHIDLETIQARLVQGSYTSSSSSSLALYRDLLLLFTNSIVFFPKLSHESLTAHHLRNLVLDHVNKLTNKSDSSHDQPSSPAPPKPDIENSDSLLARHNKSSAPIIVCRKRSSVSAKPSSSAFTLKAPDQPQTDDNKKPPPVENSLLKAQEKPVTTGTRSSRRISNNNNIKKPANTDNTPNGKQNATSPAAKIEMQDDSTPNRTEKKKMEVSASDKKKIMADFLKRIKKNSPAAEVKKNSKGGEQKKKKKKKNNNNNTSSNGKKEKGKEKVMRRRSVERKQGKEETSPSKRSVGRPPKKEAEASGAAGKRGRKEAKQPRKRARR